MVMFQRVQACTHLLQVALPGVLPTLQSTIACGRAVTMAMYPSMGCIEAPLLQQMTTDLQQLPGVVVRQQSQWGEVIAQSFGVPWEAVNKYKVSAIPDRVAARGESWAPTGEELDALPEMLRVEEQSSIWARTYLACTSCLNLRPLQLHFTEHGAERVTVERPFKLGGCCGCPLESTVRSVGPEGQRVLGMVKEDFQPYCNKCCAGSCKFLFYTKVLEQASPGSHLTHKYTLRTGLACCGRVNNCCGGTCCKPDLVIDVLDSKGQLVGVIRKTYAPSNDCSACCRMMSMFSNYVFEFPKEATASHRALLLSAIFHVDYQLFERKGGGGDGQS